MKKFTLLFTVVLTLALFVPVVHAQNMSKSDQQLMKKMEKEAHKEAKALKRDGWKVATGLPTIESQIMEARLLSIQRDDNGYPLYVQGDAMTEGSTYDAAMFAATSIAKTRMAEAIETQIVEIINTKEINKEISVTEARSLNETVATSKSLVAQKLGRVVTPVKIYRDLPNGKVEVRLMCFYSQELAMESFVQVMHEDLLKEANDLSDRIEDILKK